MPRWVSYALLLLSLAGYILLGYFIERSNFTLLFTLYSSLFLLAYIIRRNSNHYHFNILVLCGLIFRFSLIFSLPALSDDFYRFVWDGRIQQLGINPFDFKPSELIIQLKDPLLLQIYPYLNSSEYFSVYPQFCQTIFKISSFIGGESLYITVIALKLMIFLSEIGSIILLKKLLAKNINSQSLQLIYILNPLVIIELSGNIHFEAFMIFFMLLMVWLINRQRFFSAAGALSLAIQAKLLPIIYIPLLIKHLGSKKSIYYGGFCFLISVAMSLVLLNNIERVNHFSESLVLYYGTFEFNGSIYLLLRTFGWWLMDYNPIEVVSKILITLSLSGMVYIYYKKTEFLSAFFWLLTCYLLFSAVVHPWYLTPLIALSAFVRFRFALLWSSLIPLSYYTYSVVPYNENYWLITVEYLLVIGFFIIELKNRTSESDKQVISSK